MSLHGTGHAAPTSTRKSVWLRSDRAVARLKLGKAGEAAEDAEEAVDIKPDWVTGWLIAADAFEALDDSATALQCCSNAYSLNNDLRDDAEFMNRVRWLREG